MPGEPCRASRAGGAGPGHVLPSGAVPEPASAPPPDVALPAGYRMPPETAPHERTLISWPCRRELWGSSLDDAKREYAGVADAVLDPYVNAIHVSLLREKLLNPVYAEEGQRLGVGSDRPRLLGEKLLAEGPDKLTAGERLLVLADQAVMVYLHQQAWQRSGESLAPWWRAAISAYRRRD